MYICWHTWYNIWIEMALMMLTNQHRSVCQYGTSIWIRCTYNMERVFTPIKRSTVGYRNIIQLITQFCIHFFFLIFHWYFSGSFSNYGIQEFFMILMIFKWSYQLIIFYNYPLISFKKSRRLFPPFFLISCNVHRLS